jgi:hypothetical protein
MLDNKAVNKEYIYCLMKRGLILALTKYDKPWFYSDSEIFVNYE